MHSKKIAAALCFLCCATYAMEQNLNRHKELFAAILESDTKKAQSFLLNNDYAIGSDTLQDAGLLAGQILENKRNADKNWLTWDRGYDLLNAVGYGILLGTNLYLTHDGSAWIQTPAILIPLAGCVFNFVKCFPTGTSPEVHKAQLVKDTIFARSLGNLAASVTGYQNAVPIALEE
ncbi:MAG: hypothetical protein AB7R69_02365 [Candidatus Babeliales bacterium]